MNVRAGPSAFDIVAIWGKCLHVLNKPPLVQVKKRVITNQQSIDREGISSIFAYGLIECFAPILRVCICHMHPPSIVYITSRLADISFPGRADYLIYETHFMVAEQSINICCLNHDFYRCGLPNPMHCYAKASSLVPLMVFIGRSMGSKGVPEQFGGVAQNNIGDAFCTSSRERVAKGDAT